MKVDWDNLSKYKGRVINVTVERVEKKITFDEREVIVVLGKYGRNKLKML